MVIINFIKVGECGVRSGPVCNTICNLVRRLRVCTASVLLQAIHPGKLINKRVHTPVACLDFTDSSACVSSIFLGNASLNVGLAASSVKRNLGCTSVRNIPPPRSKTA